MLRKVSIAAIRRAAQECAAEKRAVTVVNIAALSQTDAAALYPKLNGGLSWLATEIGLTQGSRWDTEAICRLYITAADYLREHGGTPSTRSLSVVLKKREETVWWYLKAHPELAKQIGLVSNEYERYYSAYRRLVRAGAALTRKRLALEKGVHRNTLGRFLKRNPGFLTECPLTPDKRWTRRHA